MGMMIHRHYENPQERGLGTMTTLADVSGGPAESVAPPDPWAAPFGNDGETVRKEISDPPRRRGRPKKEF